jgi:hypothetical protein
MAVGGSLIRAFGGCAESKARDAAARAACWLFPICSLRLVATLRVGLQLCGRERERNVRLVSVAAMAQQARVVTQQGPPNNSLQPTAALIIEARARRLNSGVKVVAGS